MLKENLMILDDKEDHEMWDKFEQKFIFNAHTKRFPAIKEPKGSITLNRQKACLLRRG